MRQKQRNRFPNLKATLPSALSRSDSLICVCASFKSPQNSHQHNTIVKLPRYIGLYCIHFYLILVIIFLILQLF